MEAPQLSSEQLAQKALELEVMVASLQAQFANKCREVGERDVQIFMLNQQVQRQAEMIDAFKKQGDLDAQVHDVQEERTPREER